MEVHVPVNAFVKSGFLSRKSDFDRLFHSNNAQNGTISKSLSVFNMRVCSHNLGLNFGTKCFSGIHGEGTIVCLRRGAMDVAVEARVKHLGG